jgi:hypothetical protein
LEELDIDGMMVLKTTYAVVRQECVDDEINIVQNSKKWRFPPRNDNGPYILLDCTNFFEYLRSCEFSKTDFAP